MTRSTSLNLPYWADLHAHFRQGAILPALAREHLAMGCYAVIAMPNTKPPVRYVTGQDGQGWSIETYHQMLHDAFGGKMDHIIVPLYLTRDTTASMIEEGVKGGALRAAKYYPPHGTTHSDHGVPMEALLAGDVLRAMEEHGVILCVHGEMHGVSGADYFDRQRNAESSFYRDVMPRVRERYPRLQIVAEHITTQVAVDFVKQAGELVAASVTPQHLLFTVGDLLLGCKTHLYCMPLLKFEEDRAALRAAVTDPANRQFFAGTDSAPHPRHSKSTDCGCAAGCYTGGIAPQLYAQAFEAAGCSLDTPAGVKALRAFLCEIGPDFYGLPKSDKQFSLIREPQEVRALATEGGDAILPLPLGLVSESERGKVTIPWRIKL